jgi:hypothetical protein
VSAKPAVLHLNGGPGMAAPIRHHDDYAHTLIFRDAAGAAIDKSASTFLAQLRTQPKSSVIVATFTIAVTGAGFNVVTWSLTDAQATAIPAKRYAWDLHESGVDGDITRVEGIAIVNENVSRP